MNAENAGQALGLSFVDEFARCGMTDACLAPGARSAPMAMALASDPRIRLHVSIDERSVAFLALGIAKASRRPVALLSTSGTAAANFHAAVIEAHHARVPLVVLTADRPPELRDTGAGQTIDQIKLYGGSVRWFAEVGVPEARAESVRYWRSLACRAYATASGSPAGPVHLNLSFRDPLVPVADEAGFPHPLDGRLGGRPWTEVVRAPRRPSEEHVRALASEIAATERGLIVAGMCDADPAPILGLAEAAAWPILAEPLSGLRRGALAISTYDALLRVEPFAREHRPDLVIRIGSLGTSKVLNSFLDPGVKQVFIDEDASWLDPERAGAQIVAADAPLACGDLLKAVPPRDGSAWLDSWRAAEAAARSAVDSLLDAIDAPTEPRVARDLAGGLPDASTLLVASSMPVRDLDWFMRPRPGIRVLANRGANGIDGFVSTALGAALASEGPTVALMGDLAFLHDQSGLLLARTEPVNATLVVLNNDGGGIFSFLPQAEYPEVFERLFGTPHGLDLGALARAYGCTHRLIGRASDLGPAVEEAIRAGGVHVVEARTGRRANVDVHRKLWEAVEAGLKS